MKGSTKRGHALRLLRSIFGCTNSTLTDASEEVITTGSHGDSSSEDEIYCNTSTNSTSISEITHSNDNAAGVVIEKIPGRMTVIIPDMFRSFMAVKPSLNTNYDKIKIQAESWMFETLKSSPESRKRISKTNFALYASMAAPYADETEFRILCDWGNWIFPFDDQFDNGALKDDPVKAKCTMTQVLVSMEPQAAPFSQQTSKSPLVTIHDSIWTRMLQHGCSTDIQTRYRSAMKQYAKGVLEHVDHFSKTPSMVEYMLARRGAVGVEPVIVLAEFANRIELSDNVYHHNSLRELRAIVGDVILIQNDVLSYCKEQSEGVGHNMIAVLRANGMGVQEAFDHCGDLLKECYRDWYLAQARVSHWSEKVDEQVRRYVLAMESIMLSNLHWHFQSDRYFGDKKAEVRKHRTITILDDEHTFVR